MTDSTNTDEKIIRKTSEIIGQFYLEFTEGNRPGLTDPWLELGHVLADAGVLRQETTEEYGTLTPAGNVVPWPTRDKAKFVSRYLGNHPMMKRDVYISEWEEVIDE